MDAYPREGSFTTSAQAQGAIEGTAKDYEVASAYATDFAFSRFDSAKDAEAALSTGAVESSYAEQGVSAAADQRRRLSEEACPPPTATVASPPPPKKPPSTPPSPRPPVPPYVAGETPVCEHAVGRFNSRDRANIRQTPWCYELNSRNYACKNYFAFTNSGSNETHSSLNIIYNPKDGGNRCAASMNILCPVALVPRTG